MYTNVCFANSFRLMFESWVERQKELVKGSQEETGSLDKRCKWA